MPEKINYFTRFHYSTHNYQQTTHATIGNGNIKTGTNLNLDSNTNNLITIDTTNSQNIESQTINLNRNITNAQETTKHIDKHKLYSSVGSG